jgi:hypothetical protein
MVHKQLNGEVIGPAMAVLSEPGSSLDKTPTRQMLGDLAIAKLKLALLLNFKHTTASRPNPLNSHQASQGSEEAENQSLCDFGVLRVNPQGWGGWSKLEWKRLVRET